MRLAWSLGTSAWIGALIGRLIEPVGALAWWASWVLFGVVLAIIASRHLSKR